MSFDRNKLTLGFDQELCVLLQDMQKELFPDVQKEDAALAVIIEKEKPEQPTPSSTEAAIEISHVDEIVEKVAGMTLSPTKSAIDECAPTSGKKREKVEKRQEDPILPLYWKQYCKPQTLIDLAERAGYTFESANGSHRKYYIQLDDHTRSYVTIPYHAKQDLSYGVARKVLAQILKFNVIE